MFGNYYGFVHQLLHNIIDVVFCIFAEAACST